MNKKAQKRIFAIFIISCLLTIISVSYFVFAASTNQTNMVDEDKNVSYDSFSKTTCSEGKCNKIIGQESRYVVDKDGEWREIPHAESLKNLNASLEYIERDEDFGLDVLDYNLTSITLNLHSRINGDVPLRIWKKNKNNSIFVINETNYKQTHVLLEEYFIDFSFFDRTNTVTIPYKFGDIIEFGFNSTTIILDDTSNNLEVDVSVWNSDNKNIASLMRWDLNGGMPALPSNAIVTDAELCLYIVGQNDAPDNDVKVCEVTTIGLSESSISPFFYCDLVDNSLTTTLSSTTTNTYACMNVTHIISEWNGAGDVGIRVEDPDNLVDEQADNDHYVNLLSMGVIDDGQGGSIPYFDFEDSENTYGTGNYPYLNVTYFQYSLVIDSPTSEQVFTQDVPTSFFNLTLSEDTDVCRYSFNSGAKNYTMTKTSSTYFHAQNTTMNDGSHTVAFYCNDSTFGDWYSNSTNFYVDSQNITTCRTLNTTRTYYLQNNISTSGDCLRPRASGITLDLNGHTATSTSQDAIDVNSGSYDNLKVFDGGLNGASHDIYTSSGSANNTMINVTYSGGGDTSSGQVERKWYFDINVTYSNGTAVSTATVDIRNNTGGVIFLSGTNSSGEIPQKRLREYIDLGSKTYAVPYYINVSKTGYISTSDTINLTFTKNILLNVTLVTSNVAPISTLDSPENNTWTISSKNNFVCNSSDSNENLKNVTLKIWHGDSVDSTNTTSISGSSNSSTFSHTLSSQGTNLWNCYICDEGNLCDWGVNRTIKLDTVKPKFSSVPANDSITYGTDWSGVDFDAIDVTSGINYYFLNNSQFTINQSGFLDTNSSILGVGTYVVNVSINDTVGNYNFTYYQLTINKETPSLNLDFTPSFPTYGDSTNVTGSESNTGDSGCVYTLHRDGLSIGSGSSISDDSSILAVGTYNYTYNTTGCENYTSEIFSTNYTIEKSTGEIYTYLNNSRSNITVESPTTIYLNATLNSGSGNVELYNNGTLIHNGTAPIFNSTIFSTIGEYNITSFYFGNENYSSDNETFFVTVEDTINPEISLVYPTNTSYGSVQTEINFTYSDQNLDSCWYSIDGGTTNITHTTCANITGLNSGEGTSNWLIGMNDSSGNEAYDTVQFFVDTANPKISYDSETEADYANKSQDFIYVNVTFIETNFANITFSLYDDSVQVNSTTFSTEIYEINWTKNIVNSNNYTYEVNITDIANNKNSTGIRHITLDNMPPLVTILDPDEDGLPFVNETITINFTVSDNLIGLDSCWWTNDSGTTNNSISCSSNLTQTLSDNAYDYTIYANDSIGNLGSASINFYISTGPPAITINAPTNNKNLSSGLDVYFNFTASDSDNLSTCQLWHNNTGTWHLNYSWIYPTSGVQNFTLLNLSENKFKYNFWCNDSLGNGQFTSINRTTLVDTSNPDVNLTSPSNGTNSSSASRNLTSSISDNFGIKNATLNIYNSSGDLKNQTTKSFGANLLTKTLGVVYSFSDGVWTWFYKIFDWSGNSADSGNYSITIDTTFPNLNIAYPSNTTYSTNVSELNYTYTEINCDSAWSSIDDGSTNSSVVSCGTNFTTLTSTEGSNTWTVYMNDSSGNENSTSVTFFKDTISPRISIIYPLNNTNSTDANLEVDYNYTEINCDSVWWQDGTGSNTTLSCGTNITGATWTEGKHNITIFMNDSANNINKTYISFLTDLNTPSLDILDPLDNEVNATSSQNITANISDTVGIKNASLLIYNSSGSLINQTNISFGSNVVQKTLGIVHTFTDGVWKWFYRIFDWVGNSATSSNQTLTIDTTYPNMNESGYSPLTIYTETNVTVYGNMTDTNLDTVWLEINYSGSYQNFTITTVSGNQYSYIVNASVVDNFENVSWRWWVNDTVGNTNVSSYNSFLVANRNPYNVTIITKNNSFINYNSFLINFSSNDADIDTINYTLYNSTNNINFSLFSSTTSGSINFTGFNNADGIKHYYYVTANDSVLQNQSNTNVFTIDKTSPDFFDLERPYNNIFGDWPLVSCNIAGIELNYSVGDTNLDYCEFNVTTGGGDVSTPHTVISDCSNTTFNVAYTGVQYLTFNVIDKSGNTNLTTFTIWIDPAQPSCSSPTTPGGGGGGGGVTVPGEDEEEEEKTFCGDNICQDTGNDYEIIENYYSCPVDCPGFDFDSLFYSFTKYCWDDLPSTVCFFGFGNKKEDTEVSVCGDNICARDEFLSCKDDCGRLSGKTMVGNCFKDEPCYWKSNAGYTTLFVLVVLILFLSLVKIKYPGSNKKTTGYRYFAMKLNKKRRRRKR